MITGAHCIIYSTNPDGDRTFLRDVLNLTHVNDGDGWLIFGLPPSEVAIHPSDKNGVHELCLMCDDIEGFAGAGKGRRAGEEKAGGDDQPEGTDNQGGKEIRLDDKHAGA